MWLGLQDMGVWLAFVLSVLSALLCLVWGILKWNQDGAAIEPESEVRQWAEEEDKVEEEL